jgi:hypothetical protein
MPFSARCPFCGHTKPLPDEAFGAQATCPMCRNQFFAIPDDSAELALAGSAAASVRTDDTPMPMPAREVYAVADPLPVAPPPPPVAPAVAVTPQPLTEWPDESEPDPEPARDRDMPTPPAALWVSLAASAGLGVAAAVAVSVTALGFLVIPLALLAVLVGGATCYLFVKRQMPGLVLAVPGVATAASAVILVLALIAPDWLTPQYEQSRLKSTYDPDVILYLPANGELVDPAKITPADGWADATKAACQQGPVRVKVVSATVGPVELTSGKPPFTKERYLTIQLQITHAGHGGPVPFSAWGAIVGENQQPTPDVQLTVAGKTVGQTDLGTRQMPGRIYHGHELAPAAVLATKLVFDLPQANEPLRLELPADAWGGKGSLRFLIPVGMVHVQRPSR